MSNDQLRWEFCLCGKHRRTAINYCPFCGRDYETGPAMKRLLHYIWAKLTGKTKFADDVAKLTYLTNRVRRLYRQRGADVNFAIAASLIVAAEIHSEAGGDRDRFVREARATWDNVIKPREQAELALKGEEAAKDNRHGRRRFKALEGGKK